MYEDWTTPQFIATEQNFLMERTCPQMPDPTGCLIGVISWWDKIAKIIFSEKAAYYVCNGINNDCLLPEKR